jgi:serine/threonine protein kinase
MLELGQRLGDFEVIRLLGKGGMGEVYEAQQFNPPRRVALKVLAPHLCGNEEVLQRFWRESEALAQLDHPGIVRVLTRGRDAGTAYYTMQLIRGLPLSRLIKEAREEPQAPQQPTLSDEATRSDPANRPTPLQAPPPREEAPDELVRPYLHDRYGFVVRVGVGVAQALSAAHRAGVLHRDLKPGNLMFDRHGHVYIVDFGLARVLNCGEGTQSGYVRGTPWYMSPEQANGRGIDERSDVYSLGATLYELTTVGKGPLSVARADRDAVLRAVRAGDVVPLRTLEPEAPEVLVRVIEKAMRFAPEDRYQTAAALLADLEAPSPPAVADRAPSARDAPQPLAREVGHESQVLQGAPSEHPAPVPAPARKRRPVLLTTALLAAAGLLAAGIAWIVLRPREQPRQEERGTGFVQSDRLGDDPLPAVLRDRDFDQEVSLFDEKGFPLYAAKVWGTGHCERQRDGSLHFTSFDPTRRTLLVLDNDVRLRWFDFSIELQRFPEKDPAANQLGVFFGYRRSAKDPDRDYPFFAVEVQDAPPKAAAPGRLLVGWSYLQRRRGAQGEIAEWLQPLLKESKPTDLPKLDPKRPWRTVRVKALDGRVRVTVSGQGTEAEYSFDVDAVKSADRGKHGDLDPRGALGIWVHKGVAYFRNASVKSLRGGGAAD